MKGLISNITRMGFSGLGNILLTTCVTGVTVTAIGLMALYLIKHIDGDTPEMKSLQCAVGVARADCPRYGAEMDALKGKLSDLAEKTAKAEGKLNNLHMVESVDSITLFDHITIPGSDLSVTVATVYSELLASDLKPASYYCYIDLAETGGVDRNLYIRNNSSDLKPSSQTLRQAGVSTNALAFAREKCKPFLIGGGK